MTNFKEISGFNKNNLNDARSKIDQALQLLREVGLEANIGKITYNDIEFTSKITVRLSSENKTMKAKIIKAEEKCFDSLKDASDKDLFLALKGKMINIDGKMLELKEFKSRNWKMPFIVGNYKMNRKQMEKYVRITFPEMTI